jgi:hypothetical protein
LLLYFLHSTEYRISKLSSSSTVCNVGSKQHSGSYYSTHPALSYRILVYVPRYLGKHSYPLVRLT